MNPSLSQADIKRQIIEDAAEIRRLHARIHATLVSRHVDVQGRQRWEEACEEFHSRYPGLAFPGGYAGAAPRIVAGDPFAIEAALCFLEVRPYFFRSGYMVKVLLRKLRQAPPLSATQVRRLEAVLERRMLWRSRQQPGV